LKKCVLATNRNAASFTSEISKKINAPPPKLRRLPCPGVHGPLRGVCESSRGLTLPQARLGLRAVSVLPRRAASCRAEAKCIRCSQFAAMATIPYKQNALCAHDMPRFSLSRRGRGRDPPAVRLVATEGTVAGVKKCHQTGRDRTVNSKRGEGLRGRGPRVLCEINRPASSCTRTATGSVERGQR